MLVALGVLPVSNMPGSAGWGQTETETRHDGQPGYSWVACDADAGDIGLAAVTVERAEEAESDLDSGSVDS